MEANKQEEHLNRFFSAVRETITQRENAGDPHAVDRIRLISQAIIESAPIDTDRLAQIVNERYVPPETFPDVGDPAEHRAQNEQSIQAMLENLEHHQVDIAAVREGMEHIMRKSEESLRPLLGTQHGETEDESSRPLLGTQYGETEDETREEKELPPEGKPRPDADLLSARLWMLAHAAAAVRSRKEIADSRKSRQPDEKELDKPQTRGIPIPRFSWGVHDPEAFTRNRRVGHLLRMGRMVQEMDMLGQIADDPRNPQAEKARKRLGKQARKFSIGAEHAFDEKGLGLLRAGGVSPEMLLDTMKRVEEWKKTLPLDKSLAERIGAFLKNVIRKVQQWLGAGQRQDPDPSPGVH